MTIYRGGKDPERLYLKDAGFVLSGSREKVVFKKSNIPGIDMEDLIARHKARYFLLGFYCRPGMRVLDFPCGSGYASQILEPFDVLYTGLEFDPYTVEYARTIYSNDRVKFGKGDLRILDSLETAYYDVIGCIEGLEHIEMMHQDNLISHLKRALRPGGVIVVSSPENPTGKSGVSVHNQYHLGELTRVDFLDLLYRHFGYDRVELLTQKAKLSTGVVTNCFYAVCRKD
jgi:2-polyprenyl-3-methyl-5-hydroxy-6-metoxy-1,4-benzoquinol methylase